MRRIPELLAFRSQRGAVPRPVPDAASASGVLDAAPIEVVETYDLSDVVDVAVVVDPAGRIVATGGRASALWPTRPAATLLGEHLVDLFASADPDALAPRPSASGEPAPLADAAAVAVALGDAWTTGVGRATLQAVLHGGDGSSPVAPEQRRAGTELMIISRRVGADTVAVVLALAMSPAHPLAHAPLRSTLRDILGSLDIGLVSLDDHGRLVFVNETMCREFSLATGPTSLAGSPATLLFHSIARLSVDPQGTVDRLLAASGHDGDVRIELELRDGRRFLASLVDARALTRTRLLLFRSIPGHEADAAGRPLDARRADLLSTASHEVRGALHGMLGLISELQDGVDASQMSELLETLAVVGNSLRSLVQQVLDVAQMDDGTARVASLPFDLRDVLREVAAVAAGALRSTPVTLTTNIDAGCATRRIGDAVRVGQILSNVVTNAATSTVSGSVVVDVSSVGSGNVRFRVHDTGSGLSADSIEGLLDRSPMPSVRFADRNRGLGLLIARDLIELLGGEVGVSVVATGTTVTIDLPLPEQPGDRPASDEHAAPTLRYERVLVVDDEPEDLSVLARAVRRIAERIEPTSDARVAVAAARQHPYDLAVIDGLMAPHDGAEVTRELRALPGGAAMRIVIATANVGPIATSRYLAAGADAVLAKPFSAADLLSLLGRIEADRSRQPFTS